MKWTDTLFRNWTRTRPIRRADKSGPYRPEVERLEEREVPAGINFLQGYAFVDLNQNSIYDTGDSAKVGSLVVLSPQNGFEAPAVALTDSTGFYRFTGLVAGNTYTLTEFPPAGFTAQSVSSTTFLSQAVASGANSVTVKLGTDSGGLMFNRTGGPIAANVPGTAFTLTNGPLNPFTSQVSNGNSHQYQGFVSGPMVNTAEFLTYCVDLFHANPATYGVVTSDQPFHPSEANLPATTAANIGRIGYLYNSYGRFAFTDSVSDTNTRISAGVKEAALGLAFYELLYDAAPNLSTGNFQVLNSTPANVITAANQFLAESVGKSQSVVFLNVEQRGDVAPNFSNSQGMLATELFNFANRPTVPPPPPPPGNGSISGLVFKDCDGDGIQDVGDGGIKGVTITLNGPGGPRTMTTDASGRYAFGDLIAGSYTLTESQPSGFNQGVNTPGTLSNGTVMGDTISGIQVGGTALVGYNFSERITLDALTLTLTKTADKDVYAPGELATYTYTVTNTSAITEEGVNVVDDNATPNNPADDFVVATGLTLASGESRTFQVTRPLPVNLVQTNNGQTLDAGSLSVERLASGDYRVVFVQSETNANDNRYGTGATPATGWKSMRGFNALVGSDQATFEFTDATGNVVLTFKVDCVSQATGATFPSGSASYPSGFGTLGVTGGEGKVLVGSAANVLFATTSITENLKMYPTGFLVNSPAETAPLSGISADPNAPNWDYKNSYTVIVSKNAFTGGVLGGVRITDIHNSPAKNGIDGGPGEPISTTLTNTAVATVSSCGVTATVRATETVTVRGATPTPTPTTPTLTKGDTAKVDFWDGRDGQTLIKSLNGGPTATALATWLATSLPNLFGANAGANNLTGKTNNDVAALLQRLKDDAGSKAQVQILATALSVYVTDFDLAGTAGTRYKFNVSTAGTGAKTFNVGSKGAPAGLTNNTTYTVFELLAQADQRKGQGTFDAKAFEELFKNLNEAGRI